MSHGLLLRLPESAPKKAFEARRALRAARYNIDAGLARQCQGDQSVSLRLGSGQGWSGEASPRQGPSGQPPPRTFTVATGEHKLVEKQDHRARGSPPPTAIGWAPRSWQIHRRQRRGCAPNGIIAIIAGRITIGRQMACRPQHCADPHQVAHRGKDTALKDAIAQSGRR